MARKPAPKNKPAPVQKVAADLHVAQLATAAATNDVMRWSEASRQIGQIQMANFVCDVADRALVEVYATIKESKAYVGMPYLDKAGKPATVSGLEDFCTAFLGKSYRRCEQLLANRHLLGPELYEQAELMGLTQRNYNAIKALPAPKQELIKAAIEGKEDRKAIVDKLVALVEQQEVEKEALAKEVAEVREDHEAAIQKTGELREKVTRLKDDVDAERTRWRRLKPEEQRQKLETAVRIAADAVCADLAAFGETVRSLLEHGDGETGAQYCGQAIAHLLVAVQTVRDDETLPVAIPILTIHSDG